MLFAPDAPETLLYRDYAERLGHTVELPPAPVINLEFLTARYRGVILDSYGVLNRAEEAIPFAAAGVAWLRDRGVAIRVVTNNAALSESDNIDLLRRTGLDLRVGEVVCSGSLLARAVKEGRLDGPVMYLGHTSGRAYLREAGLGETEDPQMAAAVVLGSSRGYRMRRIALARRALRREGVVLAVLNPDAVAPRPHGVMARVSGITARSLQRDTGCPVLLLGKPFPDIYALALERLGLGPTDVVAVGDTLATDILGARSAGIDCALALTGVTPPDLAHQLAREARIWPTYLLPDLRPPHPVVPTANLTHHP